MRKVLATVIAFVFLGKSAFGDSFNGNWICSITNAEDNSTRDMAFEISGKTLKYKWRGTSFYEDNALVHKGKVNPFLVLCRKETV